MKVLTTVKKGFEKVISTGKGFKKTFTTTGLFLTFMTRAFVIFLFTTLSMRGVLYAFTHISNLMGFAAILFFFNLSIWLYLKNMHNVKGILDAIDGLVASLFTFGFVYLVSGTAIFIARSLSFQFSNMAGWIVFGSCMVFFMFLFVRLNVLYRAND